MASSSKDRQPRLRASCDGCFLAKVKCSKARPICSRCLACGIDCRYSPSSRAGKPKSDSSSRNSSPTEAAGAPMPEDRDFVFSGQGMQGLYGLDGGWLTPPEMAEAMARGHSLSTDLSMYGIDEESMAGADMYAATGMPWTPPADMDPSFESPLVSPLAPSHARSQSYDFGSVSSAPWADASPTDMYTYCPPTTQMPTPTSMTYSPSPAATPRMGRPEPSRHKSAPSVHTLGGSGGPPCICFTVCLQSLQALHNASSPATAPAFDVVLSLNRKAVDGCAAMLACPRCMSRSGTHTAAMLLATVIGKITSFYRNASQAYFEGGGYAAHSADDSRWLELEILARELRKLEEVYARFREICCDLSEDVEVSRAMIGYLGHNLGSTMEVVSHRKTGMAYA